MHREAAAHELTESMWEAVEDAVDDAMDDCKRLVRRRIELALQGEWKKARKSQNMSCFIGFFNSADDQHGHAGRFRWGRRSGFPSRE